MIEYNIEKYKPFNNIYIKLSSNNPYISGIFESSSLHISSKDDWIDGIKKVISDEIEHCELGTEIYSVDVYKDRTEIFCNYDDDEGFLIDTREFFFIAEDYFANLEAFEKTGELIKL